MPNTFDSDKFRSFQDSFDWKLFENDFENIIKSTYPEVVEIRRIMETYSSVFVSLSGSGSTMFGVFKDFLKADIAYQQLKNYNCHIVKPLKEINVIGGSSNGRTHGFGPWNRGSTPCPPALQ